MTSSTDPFVTHRNLLFTVAYEMLGSAADAEDVVQETWLRWAAVDQCGGAGAARLPGPHRHPAGPQPPAHAWRRRREDYVGEWLPEPLLTAPDVAEDVELAESVSMAMLHGARDARRPPSARCSCCARSSTCRTTRSAPRSGKTSAAVRQIALRARNHVASRRPRHDVDRVEQQAVVERFLAAVQTGDLQALMDAMAPDVLLRADGGGIAQAIRKPLSGHEPVARLLANFAMFAPDGELDLVWLNGAPAALIRARGELTAVSFAIEDGLVSNIYVVRNPHKLTALDTEAQLSRDA